MSRTLRLAMGVLALGSAVAPPAAAQTSPEVGLYALGLAAGYASSPFMDAGSEQLGRFRIMANAHGDRSMGVEVAWEHLWVRSTSGSTFGLLPGTPTGNASDWLPLSWVAHSSRDLRWTHRLDRLALSWEGDRAALTVGRQTISWATTLFLTPADPFAPFDPSDPFREYRGGVDAARLRVFPGPFTELELVVRAAGTPTGDRATALARVQTSVGGWALGGWGGWVHEHPSVAAFASGALGSSGLRVEARVQERPGAEGAAARVALGVDRRFSWSDRDVFAVWEVQYDGLGAASGSELPGVAASAAFAYGELQVLSRWTSMAQASVQLHPLVAVDALGMWSLSDGSVLVAPGVAWSASPSVSVRGGAYLGAGREVREGGLPASEYGALPAVGYLSLSWFH